MIYLMGGVCVLMLWERGGERRREEERECVWCVIYLMISLAAFRSFSVLAEYFFDSIISDRILLASLLSSSDTFSGICLAH